ncbi:MAG: fgrK [Betaproteobacteria bacterium]|nr:fgrK [Betaproteobacteria bacterium]
MPLPSGAAGVKSGSPFMQAMGVRSTVMLLVAVIAIPFLMLAIVSAQRNLRFEQNAAEQRALTHARQLTARIDDLVGGVDDLLVVLAQTLSPDPADAAQNGARLARIGARLPPVYSQLRISTPQGAAIGHSTGVSPNIGGRKYFRDALLRPGLATGEPARSYRNGIWTMGFGRAIHDPAGKVLAVVSVTLRLEHLHQIFDDRGLPEGSILYVLSERGMVLARSADQEHWIGRDVSRLPTGKRALELKDGAELIVTREGTARLTGIASAKRVPWLAVIASPTESAFAGVRAEERRSLLLFLAACGFALVAGLMAARRLILPIRRITADAVAFGGGDLAHRSTVAAPAEMGVLARTFNRMADDMAARTASLETSEARYRSMFQSSPQPMWVVDRETLRFLAVNDAAMAQYGYSREEFLAMEGGDIRPPEEHGRFRAYLQTNVSGVRAAGVWRHRRKDGSLIEVEISTHELMFDGRPALHSALLDVTERLRMEREVRRLNLDLEERVRERTAELSATNRELEAFTYSVSHDLHNPLRAIDGFSKLLLDHPGMPEDSEARDYLERIRGAAQRMGGLIAALLNLSRVSRGTLRKTHVDLSALAAQAAEELQQQAPQRMVEWRIAPGLSVDGDAGLLRSVLSNLLGNAWKYTRNQPRPVIEFGLHADTAERAEFFVRDNGAGFDMAYSAKLFAVFQRLHSPAEFEGNGIGLATVQRIVERHGGSVRGEGRPGEGTTLYFSLPRQGQAPG